MWNVTDVFNYYSQLNDRKFDIKVNVDAVTYGNTTIVELEIDNQIIPDEEFTLGDIACSSLKLKLRTNNTIPTNAKICPYIRFTGATWNTIPEPWMTYPPNWEEDGFSEWLPLGEFYIDTRKYQNEVWTLNCLDKLITFQQVFVSALTFPVPMSAVLNEMCTTLGITIDSSVVINPAYMIPYDPDGEYTMREMLGFIAAAHGASCQMTKDGKLGFKYFITNYTTTSVLASHIFKAELTNPEKIYSRLVIIYNDDGEYLERGTDTMNGDRTLTIFNPFITDTMMDAIFANINGFAYQPISMDWKCMPQLDVGDGMQITLRDGTVVNTVILHEIINFKGGLKSNTQSPSASEQRSEFVYTGPITSKVKHLAKTTIKENKPYYGVVMGRANGLKITRSDGASEVILNSDTLEFKAGGTRKLYFNPTTNRYEFKDGNIIVTDQNDIIRVLIGKLADGVYGQQVFDKDGIETVGYNSDGKVVIKGDVVVKDANDITRVKIGELATGIYGQQVFDKTGAETLGYDSDGKVVVKGKITSSDIDVTSDVTIGATLNMKPTYLGGIHWEGIGEIYVDPGALSLQLSFPTVILPSNTKVDNQLVASQTWVNSNYLKADGDSGSFTTADGKTVTVVKGKITNIT